MDNKDDNVLPLKDADGKTVAPPSTPRKPPTWVEERMVLFAPEQWVDFRRRVSEKLDALDLHESERESVLGKIRNDHADLERLMRAIKTGGEMRAVTLTEKHHFETNTVDVVDANSGEIIRTRAMTGDERAAAAQTELPIVDPPTPDQPKS